MRKPVSTKDPAFFIIHVDKAVDSLNFSYSMNVVYFYEVEMALPISVKQDLDEVIKIANSLYLETIRLQQKACDFVNQGEFDSLLSEFKWSAEVANVISLVRSYSGTDEKDELDIRAAATECAKLMCNLIGDIDEAEGVAELSAVAEKYEDTDFENEIGEYIESQSLYNDFTVPRDIAMDVISYIEHYGGVGERVKVCMEFQSPLLERWIDEHTMVNGDYLMFVE